MDPASPDQQLLDLRAGGASWSEIGRVLGKDESAIRRRHKRLMAKAGTATATATATITPRMPEPAEEAGGVRLPEPFKLSYEPFRIDGAGRYLVISDIHIPFHDVRTLTAAFDEAVRVNAVGVIYNGDLMDCYQLSHHYKEPNKARFKEEVEKTRQFLMWARSKLPAARHVYKLGNHCERVRRYVAERAPALFDIEEFDLQHLLREAAGGGLEFVGDKRVIELGKLNVVHGHEFAKGGGVMPARWLFLRGAATALCGHFHQPSQYTFRTLDRREISVWSTGCACFLEPEWLPNNQWAHGWAVVEVDSRGHFSVANRRLLKDGTVA